MLGFCEFFHLGKIPCLFANLALGVSDVLALLCSGRSLWLRSSRLPGLGFAYGIRSSSKLSQYLTSTERGVLVEDGYAPSPPQDILQREWD